MTERDDSPRPDDLTEADRPSAADTPDQADKPSQAEGDDSGSQAEQHEVLPAEGKPSQADA